MPVTKPTKPTKSKPVAKTAVKKTPSKKGDPITVGPFAKKPSTDYVKSETQTRKVGKGKEAVKEARIFRNPNSLPITKEERETATKKQRQERNAGKRTVLDFQRGQDSLVTEAQFNKEQAKAGRTFKMRQIGNKIKKACTPKGKASKSETRSRDCSKPGKGS